MRFDSHVRRCLCLCLCLCICHGCNIITCACTAPSQLGLSSCSTSPHHSNHGKQLGQGISAQQSPSPSKLSSVTRKLVAPQCEPERAKCVCITERARKQGRPVLPPYRRKRAGTGFTGFRQRGAARTAARDQAGEGSAQAGERAHSTRQGTRAEHARRGC